MSNFNSKPTFSPIFPMEQRCEMLLTDGEGNSTKVGEFTRSVTREEWEATLKAKPESMPMSQNGDSGERYSNECVSLCIRSGVPAGICQELIGFLGSVAAAERFIELCRTQRKPEPATAFRVKRIGPSEVPLPTYATPGSAGMDLCAAIEAPVWLVPGERRHIGTGIAVEIPPGYEGQVRARSGLAAKHGIGMVNGVGTIDSDYRGELGLLLINHGAAAVEIYPLMRCAHLVIAPVVQLAVVVVDELSGTNRGTGGFGSTGNG